MYACDKSCGPQQQTLLRKGSTRKVTWRVTIRLMFIFRYIVQCTCIHTCPTLYIFLLTRSHCFDLAGCKCGRNMASWRSTSFVAGIWRCILEEVLMQFSPQFPISIYRWGCEDSVGWSLCVSPDANIHFLLGWACCSIDGIVLHLNAQ